MSVTVENTTRSGKTALSKLLGVSLPTIHNYCNLPDCPSRDPSDKTYDTIEFVAFYGSKRREMAKADGPKGDAKERLEEAKAAREEIKLAEDEGRLVDAEAVSKDWVEVATMIKGELMGQPQKVAPELLRIVQAGGAEAEICAFLIAANKDVLRHLALNA